MTSGRLKLTRFIDNIFYDVALFVLKKSPYFYVHGFTHKIIKLYNHVMGFHAFYAHDSRTIARNRTVLNFRALIGDDLVRLAYYTDIFSIGNLNGFFIFRYRWFALKRPIDRSRSQSGDRNNF